MDPGMNQLLKWSIENADASRNDPSATSDPKAEGRSARPLNAEALISLMGGPSDADLMKESMTAILSPDITLQNKLVAFDNFEQLIETIDNTNNLQSLGLWTPLVGLLTSEEPDLRRMAAWCVGTAVQNNVQAQERALVVGAVPILMKLAVTDDHELVRRKAIYALSSEIRNYQPALNAAVDALPEEMKPIGTVDAGEMEVVDQIVEKLRNKSAERQS